MNDDQALKQDLVQQISDDAWRMNVLRTLHREAPNAWVAAGFVRNLVWDVHFGDGVSHPLEDVDVLIMDALALDPCAPETEVEDRLCHVAPAVPWSVKNQARMHVRNYDMPYRDIQDAMAHWLETATGVAVRLDDGANIEVLSAYGLEDLMAGILRPTDSGLARPDQLRKRIAAKGWRGRWPGVRVMLADLPERGADGS